MNKGLFMKYFVLKPGSNSRHDPYARASREAMRAYARTIDDHDPELAKSLSEWASNCTDQAMEMPVLRLEDVP